MTTTRGTMSTFVKPCPFCGGPNTEVCVFDTTAWVICRDCRATGPARDGTDGRERAIAAWNRRRYDPDAYAAAAERP